MLRGAGDACRHWGQQTEIKAMNDTTFELDEIETEALVSEVSDETLEAAADRENGRAPVTLMFYSCGSCP